MLMCVVYPWIFGYKLLAFKCSLIISMSTKDLNFFASEIKTINENMELHKVCSRFQMIFLKQEVQYKKKVTYLVWF